MGGCNGYLELFLRISGEGKGPELCVGGGGFGRQGSDGGGGVGVGAA